MSEKQGKKSKIEKQNYNALQRALEALILAMDGQITKTQSEETGLESLL